MKIPITWCLYFGNEKGPVTGILNPDIIDVRKDFFLKRFKLGDKIGIHVHATDPREQYKFIRMNAEKIEAEGFPYPKTHAPAWFYLDEKVFKALDEAEFEVDAGVLVCQVSKYSHSIMNSYGTRIFSLEYLGISSIFHLPSDPWSLSTLF